MVGGDSDTMKQASNVVPLEALCLSAILDHSFRLKNSAFN